MEAFSLLKYWRGGGSGGVRLGLLSSPDTATSPTPKPTTTTTTVLTAVAQTHPATDTDTDTNADDDDDDGPFFDLEFTVPDEADDSENPNANHSGRNSEHHSEAEEEEEDDDDDNNIEECEREFNFTLSPSANDRSDPNLSLSPSDDLFFKGKLVQVDPSSYEPNSKPQFTASLLKSATKFRVFMLGLKKSKSNANVSDKDSNGSDSAAPNPKQPETAQVPESQKKQPDRKLFTVKFKVEEVPIMSLFTRDNSSRSNNNKSQNQRQNPEDSASSSEEKRFSKEVMQKYLKMVKPLYIRVSRRYGDKLGFSGNLNLGSGSKAAPPPSTAEKKAAPAKAVAEKAQTEADGGGGGGGESVGSNNSKSQKQGNLPLPAGLRVVCKHLGKSRSASSAVAAAPPPALLSSKRRDDSLLQQQDGIQGAILHCKRSFNASRECESSQLPRSVSDPLHEMPSELSRNSTNEGKDKRL